MPEFDITLTEDEQRAINTALRKYWYENGHRAGVSAARAVAATHADELAQRMEGVGPEVVELRKVVLKFENLKP